MTKSTAIIVNGRTFTVDTSRRTMRKVVRLHNQMVNDIERISHRQLSELTGEPLSAFSMLKGLAAQEAVTEILSAASISVLNEKGSSDGL